MDDEVDPKVDVLDEGVVEVLTVEIVSPAALLTIVVLAG